MREKWSAASADIFREIRRNWQEPLEIEDMMRAGGFDPELLDIDVIESSSEEKESNYESDDEQSIQGKVGGSSPSECTDNSLSAS